MQDGQKNNIPTLPGTGVEEISKRQDALPWHWEPSCQMPVENSFSAAVGWVRWGLPGAGMGLPGAGMVPTVPALRAQLALPGRCGQCQKCPVLLPMKSDQHPARHLNKQQLQALPPQWIPEPKPPSVTWPSLPAATAAQKSLSGHSHSVSSLRSISRSSRIWGCPARSTARTGTSQLLSQFRVCFHSSALGEPKLSLEKGTAQKKVKKEGSG